MQQLDLFGNLNSLKPEEKKPPHNNPAPSEQKREESINDLVAIAEETLSSNIEDLSGRESIVLNDPAIHSKEVEISPGTSSISTVENLLVNKAPKPVPGPSNSTVKGTKPEQKRGRKSFKDMDAEVDLIEIPEDEVLFQKQYYAISQVAEWFKVNTSLVRFWENEFDVLKPKKNRKGDRLFRPEDVKNLHLIYHLLRQRKYTIEGAKEYMKTHKDNADLQFKLTNSLEKIKSFLLDLKANF